MIGVWVAVWESVPFPWPQAILLTVLVLTAGSWGVIAYRHKRHVTQQRLEMDADYEHTLWMRGNPVGFYGRYQPYTIDNILTLRNGGTR